MLEQSAPDLQLVGRIYDCAIDPAQWEEVLIEIRNRLSAAYVQLGFGDTTSLKFGGVPTATFRHTPWDRARLEEMVRIMSDVPDGQAVYFGDLDVAWTQLGRVPEELFQQSPFYQTWVKPQNLRDCIAASFIQRPESRAMFSAPSFADRAPFDKAACGFVETILPHLRRAIMINDVADKTTLGLTLARNVLDKLSGALIILDHFGLIVHTNAKGEMLVRANNFFSRKDDELITHHPAVREGLLDAVKRSIRSDAELGIRGIGLPLVGRDGARAAAYVVPLNCSDTRSILSNGYCAVFIAERGEQLPVTIEILRTMFDMTAAEARTAALVARGDAPASIAESLGLSINTVRTQIAKALAKADVDNMTALAGLVNALVPPVLG